MNIFFQQKAARLATLLITSTGLLVLPLLFSSLWFLTFFGLIPLFFLFELLNKNPDQRHAKRWSIISSFSIGWIYFTVFLYPLSTLNTWWWTVSGSFWEYKHLIYFLVCVGIALLCNIFTFGILPFTFKKPIICALIWAFAELLRVKILFGLEWAVFGQPLGNNLFFARAAAFGGIFTLSFIVVLVNMCLFQILNRAINETNGTVGTKSQKLMPFFILFMLAIGVFAQNHLVSGRKIDTSEQKIIENIFIVSPDIKTDQLTQKEGIDQIFSLIQEKIDHISGKVEEKEGIILLPENIFPLLVIDEETRLPLNYRDSAIVKENFDLLIEISQKNPEISMVFGLHTTKNGQRFNSMLTLEQGKLVSIYNKQDLLPFTEKALSLLDKNHIEPLENGDGERLIETKYGRFEPLICSEALISPISTNFLRKKPKNKGILINLSNDNIFDSDRVTQYHETILRLRAINENRTLVRSAKGGFSGFFEPSGRVVSTF